MAMMIREKINFRYLLMLPVGSRISTNVIATIIIKIFSGLLPMNAQWLPRPR
jgi:hypothetical protein